MGTAIVAVEIEKGGKVAKITIVNFSQLAKYNRWDPSFFVMLDEMKEDIARFEKQFDKESLIKMLMSFPDEIKNLLTKIPGAYVLPFVIIKKYPYVAAAYINNCLPEKSREYSKMIDGCNDQINKLKQVQEVLRYKEDNKRINKRKEVIY